MQIINRRTGPNDGTPVQNWGAFKISQNFLAQPGTVHNYTAPDWSVIKNGVVGFMFDNPGSEGWLRISVRSKETGEVIFSERQYMWRAPK